MSMTRYQCLLEFALAAALLRVHARALLRQQIRELGLRNETMHTR